MAIVFADPLLRLWLNDTGYTQAAWTLRLLSVGLFVNVIAGALSMVSQGRGEPQYQMRATLVQALTNLVLSVVLVILFGYFGAVAGTVTATILGGVLFFHTYGKRMMPDPLTTLFSATMKPVLCVFLAGSAGYLAGMAGRGFPSPAVRIVAGAELLPGMIVFAVVYVLSVRFAGVLTSDDRGFFRNALPAKVQRLLWLQ